MSAPTSDPFHESLLQGMHTAAQPLAILRAKFYPELVERMNEEELRELASTTTAQVERLCTLFANLQQLVGAGTAHPKVENTEVQSLLEYVIEGMDLWFQDSGMQLKLLTEGALPPVSIDPQRTRQALSSILLIAHSVSTSGDHLEMTASEVPDGVQVTVCNQNSAPKSLSGESNLGLAVAETYVRSQGGDFSLELQPFAVTVRLPAALLQN
ncbi:MAG TPA: hypothetical protein VGN16_10655 [Acidobacteriaceae bacterium]|jgi:signal transduction histidine kinase